MLRSKAESTVEELGEDYCMLGIVNERYVAMEVEKMEPAMPELQKTVELMREQNVGVRN